MGIYASYRQCYYITTTLKSKPAQCNFLKAQITTYRKATGIVRRVDELGRVVIPKEIRRTMRIREGDPSQICAYIGINGRALRCR